MIFGADFGSMCMALLVATASTPNQPIEGKDGRETALPPASETTHARCRAM
jgi:hypothetical protein